MTKLYSSPAAKAKWRSLRTTPRRLTPEELTQRAVRHALFPVSRRAVRRDAKRYMRALFDTTEKLRKELRRPLVGEPAFQRAVSLGGWNGLGAPK